VPSEQPRTRPLPRYRDADVVDFVIVGSGAAGGIVARELSRAGLRVVVLEQGPYLTEADFTHDELAVMERSALTTDVRLSPQTARRTAQETATPRKMLQYGRAVGGGTLHFTANFWRFHEIDFVERSKRGTVAGTSFDDWPIRYADLEPYYTKVDWEIGISGLAGASPFDPPRSKPYPMPPLPNQSPGVLLERAARKVGWHAFPAPLAIASVPYRGRGACQHCGFCEFFGCEFGAKSSTLATMIREAERTGVCEIRPNSVVHRVEHDARGRVTGVAYFDAQKRDHVQRAKAVVLCANGGETPRLLLNSASSRFPHGLANSSGWVGQNLMFNGAGIGVGVFERPVNGYRGVAVTRVVHDTYELDPKLGLHGGGGFDFRFDTPPVMYALGTLDPAGPTWGPAFKQQLRDFPRTVYAFGHTTSLPVPTNNITLDPTVKDAWGQPAIRVTFREHPEDLKLYDWFRKRSLDLLDAAGAKRTWSYPITDFPDYANPHLLGTCRMGNDPRRSVVNAWHRAHDVPNLFIVDGSSFVTSGRGQPTMTIMALAFRAAEGMIRAARRNEI
jgi:choline dehydrogenase-like flavoprotein